MEITLSELIKLFGGTLDGQDCTITGVAPITLATKDHITFLSDKKQKKNLLLTNASAIILRKDDDLETLKISKIITNNPYWYYSKVAQLLYPRKTMELQIAKTVITGKSCSIDNKVAIADYVVIGDNVSIDGGAQIFSHVVIGNNVKIGKNVYIYPNVTICDNVEIGDNCTFHSGVVIGSEGFGNARDSLNHWSHIPQIGGVKIGNDVDIGANTTIDCGTFTPTIIEDGVIIDNLVQIAHNVVIGAYTAIAACVGIAGSTKIGKFCQLGGGCGITGHIEIADYTVIGASTGISKSITKPDLYFAAYPFSTFKEWAKNAVHIKQLHDMYTKINNLENKIDKLIGESNDDRK